MQYIRIGQITKPQGIRGELKVQMLTEDPSRFSKMKEVFIESKGNYSQYAVKSSRLSSDAAFLTLEGVNDCEAAEKFRGTYICVDRENAIQLPEGRYFIFDLIGCEVFDTNGEKLGQLVDVMQYGSADVYRIEGVKSLMVPALKKLLTTVDVEAKRIVLDAGVLTEVAVWDED